MASEITVAYKTGQLLYVLIFNTVGEVWNFLTAVFEAVVNSDWTDYELALAEQGTTGIYEGNFPALSAGNYSVIVYQQKGSGPLPSDGPPLAPAQTLEWDGSKEIGLNDIMESVIANGGSNPYLLARIYGEVAPQDSQGNQTFFDVNDPTKARVTLSPTTPRGGRSVTLDP